MDKFESILLEQYFPYNHMNINERSFYINLLLNTKDISDSEVCINNKSSCKYDFVFLNLSKIQDKYIKFDGVISNDSENRMINGEIFKYSNKYIVRTNVYRCNDFISEDNKEYSVLDEFVMKDERVFRKTRYDHGYFESEIELMSEMEVEEYLQDKIQQIKLKR